MLSIRLQRVGRKNEPTFRVVLTDSKNGPKSGKFLEVLGSYDSRRAEKAQMDEARIKHLMSKGAKLSDTLHNFLVERKVIEGKKVNVLPLKRPIKKDEVKEAAKEEKKEEKSEEKSEEKKVATDEAPAGKPAETKELPSTAPVDAA